VRELDFRQPLAARIFALAFCGGFVIYVAASTAVAFARQQDVSGAPFAIGMALFAAALGSPADFWGADRRAQWTGWSVDGGSLPTGSTKLH
jgi:hypothetical protein